MNMIFEAKDYKKIEKLAVPVTDISDNAINNIIGMCKGTYISIDRILEYIEVIRKEAFKSGVHKGLELERAKEIKWKYDNNECIKTKL